MTTTTHDALSPEDGGDHTGAPRQTGTQSRPAWFYAFVPNRIGAGATINLTPLYLTEVLGASVAAVGVTIALTSAASLVGAGFWRWLRERSGRGKRYLILGYLGFAIPTMLFAFTVRTASFMALAVLLGAWSVAGAAVTSALIMSSVPRSTWEEVFGRFNMTSGWGVTVGRLLGLALITWGTTNLGSVAAQRTIWLVAGGLGLVSVFWATATVPASRTSSSARVMGDSAQGGWRRPTASARLRPRLRPLYHGQRFTSGAFFSERLPAAAGHLATECRMAARNAFIQYCGAMLVLFLVSVLAYTPFVVWQLKEVGNGNSAIFLVGLMNSLGSALSLGWLSREVRRRGSLPVQIGTVAARALVLAGFALTGFLGLTGGVSVAVLAALNLLSGVSWAGIAVTGNATAARLAPRGSEGAAVGAYTTIVSVGSILGALLSGFVVLRVGYEAVFVAAAVGVAITAIILKRLTAIAQ